MINLAELSSYSEGEYLITPSKKVLHKRASTTRRNAKWGEAYLAHLREFYPEDLRTWVHVREGQALTVLSEGEAEALIRQWGEQEEILEIAPSLTLNGDINLFKSLIRGPKGLGLKSLLKGWFHFRDVKLTLFIESETYIEFSQKILLGPKTYGGLVWNEPTQRWSLHT